jgi:hypothetical protein
MAIERRGGDGELCRRIVDLHEGHALGRSMNTTSSPVTCDSVRDGVPESMGVPGSSRELYLSLVNVNVAAISVTLTSLFFACRGN